MNDVVLNAGGTAEIVYFRPGILIKYSGAFFYAPEKYRRNEEWNL
jgi:hypothetical protein